MNLYLRTFFVWLCSFFRARIHFLDTSVLKLVILPNDLDVYGHLNNGRYLTLMDLGRMDIILRTEIARLARKKKWKPIVAASFLEHYKSLKLFQTFELKTRILCWDEKWIYIEQRFEKRGRLLAVGLIKGLLAGPHGRISSQELMKELGMKTASPAFPETVTRWQGISLRT